MAVAFVQAKSNEAGSSTNCVVTPTSSPTVGNLLVIGVYAFSETTSSITVHSRVGTSNTTDTFTKVLTTWQNDGGSDFLNLYWGIVATSGITNIQASGPSASGFWGVSVAEFSGVGSVSASDGSGSDASNFTNPFNGPTFTATGGDLLVAFYGDEGPSETITTGNGWTQGSYSGLGQNNNAISYISSATAGSTHPQWSNADTGQMASGYVTFTPVSGGPTDPFPAGYGPRQLDVNAVYRI